MESGYLSSSRGGRRKIFRDNVHGYIDVPYSVVSELIDTPLFQRLQYSEESLCRVLYLIPGPTDDSVKNMNRIDEILFESQGEDGGGV